MEKMTYQAEVNSGEIKGSTAGYIPLKDQIKAMTDAGKKLVQHRALAYPMDIEGEEVETSVMGKRYFDKLDVAELSKESEKKLEDYARKAREKPTKPVGNPTENLAQNAAGEGQEQPPPPTANNPPKTTN